jgi:hypothetical protein
VPCFTVMPRQGWNVEYKDKCTRFPTVSSNVLGYLRKEGEHNKLIGASNDHCTPPPLIFSVSLYAEHKSLPQNKASTGSSRTHFESNISPVPYATSASRTGWLTTISRTNGLCVAYGGVTGDICAVTILPRFSSDKAF